MISTDSLRFQKNAFPAQFFLQVEEGMARFDVPTEGNLKTLLEYCEKQGYQVEWTEAVEAHSELAEELKAFPGGRYVGHRFPDEVLDPNWAQPEMPAESDQSTSA